jgi:hypothetical protein
MMTAQKPAASSLLAQPPEAASQQAYREAISRQPVTISAKRSIAT